MHKLEIEQIIHKSASQGWVMEPETKQLLGLAGLTVPCSYLTTTRDHCQTAINQLKGPLVAKIISPEIIHKTEVNGVATNIRNKQDLYLIYDRLAKLPGFKGVLIEETASGVELIVGAKNDLQFGPVILLGIGGTGVEIYRDTVIRMAPLKEKNAQAMINNLIGKKLITGYRGGKEGNQQAIIQLLLTFSNLVMEIADYFESIDINPLFCNTEGCVIADARIILKR